MKMRSSAPQASRPIVCPTYGRTAFVRQRLPCTPNDKRTVSVAYPCSRSTSVGRKPLKRDLTVSPALAVEVSTEAEAPQTVFSKRFDDQALTVEVVKAEGAYHVSITAHQSCRRVLHWAVNEWDKPAETYWPAGTVAVDAKAVQTPFENGVSVRISIPQDVCPSTLVFVVKELDPERWVNAGASHFTVVLRQPDAASLSNKVITAESEYANWSLFHRLCLVLETLDAAALAGPTGMALIFTWLRLSANRVLPWYKNSNYQSKDIAHVQKSVAENMAEKARCAEDPLSRMYARMALAGLPRGGGNGDDIRMGILHIMRGNNIKEGHRPGIDERFLEEWHQKLHTNTTPDDITICEAYLAYLHSNNHDDYWRVMWERGRLSRQDLENFSKPITAWPMHLPQLIPAFQHFLWILKITHSGADLDTAFTMASGLMDEELRWMIGDILQNRNEWWVPGKIVTARQRLAHYWKAPGASRDLLLLDISLDNWFRTLMERTPMDSLGRDSLVDIAPLVLRNALVALEDEELAQCLSLWERLANTPRWDQEWSMLALAAVQRSELSLAAFMDTVYEQVQPYAERFGKACALDPKFIINFGEEVVRGHPAFTLSQVLQALEPQVRQAAGVSSWQMVSQAPATGVIRVIPSLADVQGQDFSEPVILVAEKVGGMEDIPNGVRAVLTRSLTDVLSHVAIRARSQHTLLASCFDPAEWAVLQGKDGHHVQLDVSPDGRVVVSDADEPAAVEGGGAAGSAPAAAKLLLEKVEVRMDGTWAIGEADFTGRRVGRKSLNLGSLRGKVPDWVRVPACVTLPFGGFERALAYEPNRAVAEQLTALQGTLAGLAEATPLPMAEVSQVLEAARKLVTQGLVAPPELIADVGAAAAAAGLIPTPDTWGPQTAAWTTAWSAVRSVWASKWTERAWLSRKARGVRDDELFMAVLLQQVVPAEYAFVLHTANPITHDPNETVGEMVRGMGETLVGSHPGRALSFSYSSTGATEVPPIAGSIKVSCFPSKRVALVPPSGGTFIARSDANGEDLEDFAGAGLYDSVPFSPLINVPIDYAVEPVLFDSVFRNSLLSKLVEVGSTVEGAFDGQHQDIEGVYADGQLYVVQARPQVIQQRG